MKHWDKITAKDLVDAKEVVIVLTEDPNVPKKPALDPISLENPFGRETVKCEACDSEVDDATERFRAYRGRWHWPKAADDEIANASRVELTNPRVKNSSKTWRRDRVDFGNRRGGAARVSSGNHIRLVADEDDFDAAVKRISDLHGSEPR